MLITLVEVWIGLLVLRVDYAFVLALLIAFADLLPILGTSSVLVPWAIFELLAGKFALGIGLLILTVILWILRNFTEPKIVGKQLGIHPVISLISMFAGVKLLGFTGLFIGPLIAILVVTLNQSGHIHMYKNAAPTE